MFFLYFIGKIVFFNSLDSLWLEKIDISHDNGKICSCTNYLQEEELNEAVTSAFKNK